MRHFRSMSYPISGTLSALCAVVAIMLFLHDGPRIAFALEIPATIIITLIPPFAWHQLKRDFSWAAYVQSVTGFCTYTLLALSLFALIAGALLVGLPYLITMGFIELLLAQMALFAACYWGKARQSPAVVGALFALTSIVLLIFRLVATS